jgi:hypothetical protein
MCDKCIQLDKKIEHSERPASGVADELTLVRKVKAQKAAFHPDEQ